MSKRSDRNAAEAKKVEDRLRDEGRHSEADTITRLRRSLSSATGTLKVLHRDNMKLRKDLGLPSFLDENKGEN